MKKTAIKTSLLGITLCVSLTQANTLPAEDHNKALTGGKGTIFSTGVNAYSLPMANMPLMEQLDFSVGNSFFRNPWVIAPATTDARDGLGPLMNTNGCQNCHIKDGRGHAPHSTHDNAVSLLVRLSIDTPQGPAPEPNYGGQLQDFANPGIAPEGQIQITYTEKIITLKGGETVSLRQPTVKIVDLGYGPLHPNTQMSARIAPPMIGLGLLEAIPESDILAYADPSDKNKDGISGKANFVWHLEQEKQALGRFGWKAGQPTVKQQNAAAFNGDLGITSKLFKKDHCMPSQKACLQAASGGTPELSDNILKMVTHYARNLAVPGRRQIEDPEVQKGEKLFVDVGCASCHRANWTTAADFEVPWLADQVISPYTDLLLHDMGEALADNRPEAQASGQEWRTPPLWGIGLAQTVSKEAGFLHDGRARTLLEAILWHGGESRASQQAFINLEMAQRQAVLAFLRSL